MNEWPGGSSGGGAGRPGRRYEPQNGMILFVQPDPTLAALHEIRDTLKAIRTLLDERLPPKP